MLRRITTRRALHIRSLRGSSPAGNRSSLDLPASFPPAIAASTPPVPPKTDRLNQVPSWEFRNRRKSFTPRQLARILWDFAYLCWANPINRRLNLYPPERPTRLRQEGWLQSRRGLQGSVVGVRLLDLVL